MSFNPQTYLQNKNPHPRDDNITFDEGPHIYTIRSMDMNTQQYIYDSGFTSVTTWNHSHFPHFNADKIIDKMMNSKNWTSSKYYGKTREEIKEGWEINRNSAANAGTKMHYDIECYYNNIIPDNDSIEYQYFKNFEKERTKPGGFGEKWKPYRTEWMIYDEELKLSGSVDMLYEDENGVLKIFDWKRSKEIKKTNHWESATTECIDHLPNSNYWHYSLQLNTYKAIIERKYNKKVDMLYLVCLHPDNENKNYQMIKVPTLTNEINDLFKERIS
jgi:ATP-dependent exoDNAse (exonuclease V) beta subunit